MRGINIQENNKVKELTLETVEVPVERLVAPPLSPI